LVDGVGASSDSSCCARTLDSLTVAVPISVSSAFSGVGSISAVSSPWDADSSSCCWPSGALVEAQKVSSISVPLRSRPKRRRSLPNREQSGTGQLDPWPNSENRKGPSQLGSRSRQREVRRTLSPLVAGPSTTKAVECGVEEGPAVSGRSEEGFCGRRGEEISQLDPDKCSRRGVNQPMAHAALV
jgi:hypothetical protein